MLLLLPGFASAKPSPDEQRLQQAQSFVDVATTLFEKKDFAGALSSLRQADQILDGLPQQALIRYNIARTLEETGDVDGALTAYTRYLEIATDEARQERAKTAIKALELKRPAQLVVECEALAKIEIAGVTTEPVPCPWRGAKLPPGDYQIKAHHDGQPVTEHTVSLEPGGSRTLDLAIHAQVQDTVAPPASTGRDPWPWVMIGSGALLAGAGSWVHLSAATARDDAEAIDTVVNDAQTLKANQAKRADLVSSFETRQAIAWACYGVGAAAIGTGVYLWLTQDDQPAAVTLTPTGVMVRW